MFNDTNNNATGVLEESDLIEQNATESIIETDWKLKLVWRNIIFMIYIHISFIYSWYLYIYHFKFIFFLAILMMIFTGFGLTAGAHRLWTHKAYKATKKLKVFLVILNSMAFQGSIIDWARDHRSHHKYSETDADPHNPKRGLFFSHIGCLMSRKHPAVFEKSKNIDFNDLLSEPILIFQKKYYPIIMPIMTFIIPTLIPIYFWNETFYSSYFMNIWRYTITLNGTLSINSITHHVGNRPYDKNMYGTEVSYISVLSLGEGSHNYHHVFPWDYKCSEFGNYSLNLTCIFLDLMAKIGWAHDLKTVSKETIKNRVLRTGDGTHPVWGWGDKDQRLEDKENKPVK
nr:acyl-CoA Delta(11) desaturase-like [Onthophagus taurus]